MKYCKACGSPVDSLTKKCTGCGKQYFSFRSKWVVCTMIFLSFFILSFVLNLFLLPSYLSLSSSHNTLTDECDSVRSELSHYQEKNSELSSLNKDLLQKNSSLSVDVTNLTEDLRLLNKKNTFLEKYLFFYFNDDSVYFHRYGCVQTYDCYCVSSGIVFHPDNVIFCTREYAISRGCTPCSCCFN